MPGATTLSFVTTLPLIVTSTDEKELDARFNAGMRLLNACLGEAQSRIQLVRVSEAYQAARKMPSATKRQKAARGKAFSAARKAYRFTDYDLQAFACRVADESKWIAQKLDKQCIQKIATRAFKAVERILFGQAKQIRFKVPQRFRSMEGKSNGQGIRWHKGQFVWGRLRLSPLIDKNDPVLLHGLNSPIKYVRLLRKELKGKVRYYAQLINEGLPFQKPKNYVSEGLVGIDLNVSNVAVVGDDYAELMPLAEKVPTYQTEIARLQRQMQRSQRTNNPDAYEPNFEAQKGRKTVIKKGKIKKGRRQLINSNRYRKAAARKRELERRKAEYAKSQNRKLVNDTLRMGNRIKTENVSVKGWQKRWGKAISAKSPGFFISELVRKAESAGGQVTMFSTQKTALSQTHLSGERIKKSLSQRTHQDVMGFWMHRDLFSAFLSRHVVEDELLLQSAQYEWTGLEQVLMEAWQRFNRQSANRVSVAESGQAQPPSERISIDLEKSGQIGAPRGAVRQAG
ncbi:MAG: transposase [Cyanobacteria bacterium P01_F01_bin.4]